MSDILRTKKALAAAADYKRADDFATRIWKERRLIAFLEEAFAEWDQTPDERATISAGKWPDELDVKDGRYNCLFWLEQREGDKVSRIRLINATHEQYKTLRLCGTKKGTQHFVQALGEIKKAKFDREHLAALSPEQKQSKAKRMGMTVGMMEIILDSYWNSVEI